MGRGIWSTEGLLRVPTIPSLPTHRPQSLLSRREYLLPFLEQGDLFFDLMVLLCYLAVLFKHLHGFDGVVTWRQRLHKRGETQSVHRIRKQHRQWTQQSPAASVWGVIERWGYPADTDFPGGLDRKLEPRDLLHVSYLPHWFLRTCNLL